MRFYSNYEMTWRFAEIIKNSGLTDEQAAERLGCSKGQISMLISGERKYHSEWVRRISDAWGIPEWQLFADPDKLYPAEDMLIIEAYRRLKGTDKDVVDKFLGIDKVSDESLKKTNTA